MYRISYKSNEISKKHIDSVKSYIFYNQVH